ncbi:MAG: universal stress protein [Desulfobacter sp.]|nr:MAG: universal stress protein [Desulfobacter sp.]
MVNIKKILAPTDCSQPSSEALLYADRIASTFNADLTVLRVFLPPAAHKYTEASYSLRDIPKQKSWEQQEEIKVFWQSIVKDGVAPAFVNLTGDPFDEIIHYATQNDVDMIVMGTHGYTGFKHIFMGSVAEKVVRYSPVPVLTVKQKGFEYSRAGE